MSSLNEAAGDGRFIDIPQAATFSTATHDELMQMSKEEIKKLEAEQEKKSADECARKSLNDTRVHGV